MKILVLGAGFAGVSAAINLSKQGGGQVDVTLVDFNNYHLFKPMLHEVGTGSVDPRHILQPIRHIMKGRLFRFVRGMVHKIDPENRKVFLCDDCTRCFMKEGCTLKDFNLSSFDVDMERSITLDYDYLVVTLGGVPNYYDIEGARENALPFNGVEDADRIRKHILCAFELANRLKTPEKRIPILTFAVVGAGPTGIELVSDLHDWLLGVLLSEFPNIREKDISLYLIEEGSSILPVSPVKVQETAGKLIREKSISVLTDNPVVKVAKDFLQTREYRIMTHTTIWTAGVKGNEVLRNSGLPLDSRDRIVVDDHLNAEGFDRVFAAGDCSIFTPRGGSHPLPQTGQVAVQQARYLVDHIHARIRGKRVKPFQYRELGSALSTGRHQALANVLGLFRLHGTLGWITWKITYLKHLLGIRLSLRSLLDWFFDITYDREATRHKI